MTKPTAKAKKKKSRTEEIAELVKPQSAKKFERKLSAFVTEMDERAEAHEQYVQAVLAVNDEKAEAAIASIVKSLQHMQGEPTLVFQGQRLNAIKGETELLRSIQTRNFRWIAVRLLSAAYQWNIQIAGFRVPKKLCAVCATPVKTKKKGRK